MKEHKTRYWFCVEFVNANYYEIMLVIVQ